MCDKSASSASVMNHIHWKISMRITYECHSDNMHKSLDGQTKNIEETNVQLDATISKRSKTSQLYFLVRFVLGARIFSVCEFISTIRKNILALVVLTLPSVCVFLFSVRIFPASSLNFKSFYK